MNLSKRELQQDNEELICLLNDLLMACDEQGMVIPDDIAERVAEFLILEDDDGGDVIEIKPVS